MKNPIQELNEHCQKMAIPMPEWQFEQKSLTPSLWKAAVVLGEFSAAGEGGSKKEAQAKAAAVLIELLKDEGIWWEDFTKRPQPARAIRKKVKVWQP